MNKKTFIKILTIFCLILSSIYVLGFSNIEIDEVEYNGEIEHLVFNTLMAFPDKALDPKNNLHSIYDESKITPTEFQNILEELYINDYVLIDINSLYKIENDTIQKERLFLPQNKKPIILSFDNISYKSSYQNLGSVDKIIIDRNNQLASYTTKKSIQDRVQYDNEFMLILEEFILYHPDFSYNNARGIMFLTGENGVLGYNTSSKNSTSKYERKRVSEVISKLKNLGWTFGSNNYSYTEVNKISDIEFAKELSLWEKEIQSLVGSTPLYAYPYGKPSDSKTQKQMLLNNNYRIFFVTNNDSSSLDFNGDTLTMSRREINGTTLRNNSNQLSHLFNCNKVYDHINRTLTFNQITQ